MEPGRNKPVHLIFSDPLVFRILRQYHIEFYCEATDYEGSSQHYHVLAAWPLRRTAIGDIRCKPPKYNFCRSLRRAKKCFNCKEWQNGDYCYVCNLDINFKWCSSPKHFENTHNYISTKPGATIYEPLLGQHQSTGDLKAQNNTEGSYTGTIQSENI